MGTRGARGPERPGDRGGSRAAQLTYTTHFHGSGAPPREPANFLLMNNSASQPPAHDLEERPFSAQLQTADFAHRASPTPSRPAPLLCIPAPPATLSLFSLCPPTPAITVFLIFLHQDQSIWIRFLKMLSLNFIWGLQMGRVRGLGARIKFQLLVTVPDVSSTLECKHDLAKYQIMQHPSGSL